MKIRVQIVIIFLVVLLVTASYFALKHLIKDDVPSNDIWNLKVDVVEDPDGSEVHVEGLIVESAAYYFETARFAFEGNTLHIQITSTPFKNGPRASASFAISQKFNQKIDSITLGPENKVVWPDH